MKEPLFRRASLDTFAPATALPTRTNHHPHYATITPKPQLRKRSGEVSVDDPRFIGYAYIEGSDNGDGGNNPGTSMASLSCSSSLDNAELSFQSSNILAMSITHYQQAMAFTAAVPQAPTYAPLQPTAWMHQSSSSLVAQLRDGKITSR